MLNGIIYLFFAPGLPPAFTFSKFSAWPVFRVARVLHATMQNGFFPCLGGVGLGGLGIGGLGLGGLGLGRSAASTPMGLFQRPKTVRSKVWVDFGPV